jgi:hypothetical protein
MDTQVSLPFDEVVVTTVEGTRQFAPSEFMALPLNTRVFYVLSHRLRFSLGGKHVDRRDALEAIGKLKEGVLD